jgi:hypothetical protein
MPVHCFYTLATCARKRPTAVDSLFTTFLCFTGALIFLPCGIGFGVLLAAIFGICLIYSYLTGMSWPWQPESFSVSDNCVQVAGVCVQYQIAGVNYVC